MRITDQYLWNIIFSLFFLALVIMGSIILETEGYRSIQEVTFFDIVLITFATFRVIRFFVYDKIFAFFREQFLDAKVTKTTVILTKPKSGPRCTISDLLSCPWCFGAWAAAVVVFFYFLTPYAFYITLFLAISAAATLLQLIANMIGWQAEKLKMESDR